MMRSLYISYDGILESLGQSQIISYLNGLSERGIDFTLLTYEKKRTASIEYGNELYLQLKNKGIEWVRLSYHKNPPVLSTFFDILNGAIRCLIIIRKNKVDIVHARGYVTSVIALFLKKVFGIKFIFDMRGFWADEKSECNHWAKGGFLYKLTKYLETVFIKSANEVIVLTKVAKPVIQRQRSDSGSVSVIPCCVNTELFKPDGGTNRIKNRLDGKFVFAHIGSLEAWYMKEEMLDYFCIAKRLIPNAHFMILSHSPKEQIIKFISDRELNNGDFTLESVEFKDMPQYLFLVDAGIIFLSLGFSKIGCWPTKFSEFISCGIPVISNSRIGDTEEIIRNNRVGVIINDFTQKEYENSLRELLRLKEDKGLRLRCRAVAEKEFSLNIGVDKYQSIYSKLSR